MIRKISLLSVSALLVTACVTAERPVGPELQAQLYGLKGQMTGFIDGVLDGCVAPMLSGKTIAEQHGETGPFRREENSAARQAAGLSPGDTVWRVAETGAGVTIIESDAGCTVGVMNVPPADTASILSAVLVGRHQFSKPEYSSSKEARSVTTRQSKVVGDRQLDVLIVATATATGGDFANLLATATWKD